MYEMLQGIQEGYTERVLAFELFYAFLVVRREVYYALVEVNRQGVLTTWREDLYFVEPE